MFGFKFFLTLLLLGKSTFGNPILIEISDEGSGYGSGDAKLEFGEGSGEGSGEILDVLGENKTSLLSADQKFVQLVQQNYSDNNLLMKIDEDAFVAVSQKLNESELSSDFDEKLTDFKTVTQKIEQYVNRNGEKAAKKSKEHNLSTIFGENYITTEPTEQEIDQLLNQNEIQDDSLNEIDVQDTNLNEIETSLNIYSEEMDHTTINPFIVDHLTPFNVLSSNDTLPSEAFHTIYYEKDTAEDKIHDVIFHSSTKKSKSKDKAARKAGKKEAKKSKKAKKRNKKVQNLETTIDPFASAEELTSPSPKNNPLEYGFEVVDYKFDVDEVLKEENEKLNEITDEF
ncbi:uncharacterized protein LOC134831846 [Culicoides brevitarsis]|uniref:uncharacterized protein LOC134831846 n=1 Tax=Culicoides brevitarsis TaxID=469753 RepID=UPI00307B1511